MGMLKPASNTHAFAKVGRGPRPDLAARNRGRTKHGMTLSTEYRSWSAMKRRVLVSTDKDFPKYGGRGIDIDPRWVESFDAFLLDMGARLQGTTLGRIDNDKGYWPANCRWETDEQQLNNRRISRFIEIDGKKLTIAQWAKDLGMSRHAIRYRLEAGWPPEQIKSAANRGIRRIP